MQTCYLIEGFSYPLVTILFLTGVLLYHTARKLKHRVSFLRAGLYFILPVLIIIAYTKHIYLLDFIQIHMIDNFNLINRSIYTSSPVPFDAFSPFFILLLPLVTALAAAYAAQGRGEVTLGILFFFMFSFWNNGFDRIFANFSYLFVLLSILFFAVNQYIRLYGIHRNTGIKITLDTRRITFYGIVAALLISLTAMAFTHSLGVKSIFQLKSDYELDKKRILKYAMDSAYSLSRSGYSSNDKKLGGPITLNKAAAFKVKCDKPLYLRGNVRDYYDGYTWKQTTDTRVELGKNNPVKITSELLRFMLRDPAAAFSDSKPGQHLDINKAVIYPETLITSTLFAPNHTFDIHAKREKIIYDDSNIFLLLKKSTRIDSYEVRYYQSQTGVELFSNLYDLPVHIPYETDSRDPVKKKYYDETVKKPYAKYLQLPGNLSDRTYRLVQSITRDCRTSKEKVARIEQYLASHYPYSLKVSAVPDKQEFIDYFLFSERKGYCTYFATAATVFCRIAGVPARYVEGFHMNDEKDAAGRYVVTNDRAHAWTEVLLSPDSGIWSIVDCVPDGAEGHPLSVSAPYWDKFAGDFYQNAEIIELPNETDAGSSDSRDAYRKAWAILVYPITVVPLLAMLSALLIISYRIYRIRRIKKQVLVQKSLIPLYQYTATRLKSIRQEWTSGTCELEAAESINDPALREAVTGLVKACYLEHYGSKEPEPFERLGYLRFIESYVRKQQSFLYYWYCRLFF